MSKAFRFDDRSSGLNRLGVDCRAAMLDLHYQTEVAVTGDQGLADASDMIVEWDRHLAQLTPRAAGPGIIVVIEHQPVSS